MASTGQAAGAGMAECAGRRGKEHARARAENPKTPQPRGCGGRSTSVAPTSSPLSHELSSHAPGGTAPRATHTHTLRGAAQHPNHTPPPRATRVPHAHRSGAHAALLSLLSVGELGHASLFRLPAFRPTQEGRGGVAGFWHSFCFAFLFVFGFEFFFSILDPKGAHSRSASASRRKH